MLDTTPNVPNVPADVISKSWDGVWLLTVKCPHCGKRHTHGGGDGARPARFGIRVSHCADGTQDVYNIVNPAA